MKVKEETIETAAEKTAVHTQLAFYSFANFFAEKILEGFFEDVIHMGAAAMLAIFSVVNLAVAVYFFYDATELLLVQHVFPLDSIIWCVVTIVSARLSVKLAVYMLAEK